MKNKIVFAACVIMFFVVNICVSMDTAVASQEVELKKEKALEEQQKLNESFFAKPIKTIGLV